MRGKINEAPSGLPLSWRTHFLRWTRHAISSLSIKGCFWGRLWSWLHNRSATVCCFTHSHLQQCYHGATNNTFAAATSFPYAGLFNDFSINIQAQPQTIINWVMSLAGNDILVRICQRERIFRSERHPSARPCVWRNLNSFPNWHATLGWSLIIIGHIFAYCSVSGFVIGIVHALVFIF